MPIIIFEKKAYNISTSNRIHYANAACNQMLNRVNRSHHRQSPALRPKPGGYVSIFRTLLAVFLVIGFETAVYARSPIVAVASNFLPTAQRLAQAFERQEALQIRLVAGATGSLYTRIVNGAGYEVFLAADDTHAAKLIALELAHADARFIYAVGILVLWAPGNPPEKTLEAVFNSDRVQRIALANPALAPYGAAAEAVMARFSFKGKTIYGENVQQAFQFVQTGNAQFGFTALSLLRLYQKNHPVGTIDLSQELYPPIQQEAVLLQPSSPEAETFFRFLRSSEARRIIQSSGYQIPPL